MKKTLSERSEKEVDMYEIAKALITEDKVKKSRKY